MQAANIPAKIQLPFANSAGSSYIRTIPVPSQIGITNGAASFTDGFPPLCFVPEAAGGYPPDGRDVQYLGNVLTAWARWYAAGGPIYYDATFSNAVGGYPAGTILQKANGSGFWRSQVDNNGSNPDTGGANWISFLSPGQIGGLVGLTSSTTLSIAQVGSGVQLNAIGSNPTLTLPPLASMPSQSGYGFWVVNVGNSYWNIHGSGTDQIYPIGTTFVINPNESVFVFNDGQTEWNAFGACAGVLTANLSGWSINITGSAGSLSGYNPALGTQWTIDSNGQLSNNGVTKQMAYLRTTGDQTSGNSLTWSAIFNVGQNGCATASGGNIVFTNAGLYRVNFTGSYYNSVPGGNAYNFYFNGTTGMVAGPTSGQPQSGYTPDGQDVPMSMTALVRATASSTLNTYFSYGYSGSSIGRAGSTMVIERVG